MERTPEPVGGERALIERAYLAFAEACRPIRIDHSPYRDPLWVTKLASTPLRAISDENIAYYSSCALTTIGNTENYRFFFPRILEGIVNGLPLLDAKIIVDRLEMAEWVTWSGEERAVIIDVAAHAANREVVDMAATWKETPWWPDETTRPQSWVSQLRRLKEMTALEPTLRKPLKPYKRNKRYRLRQQPL